MIYHCFGKYFHGYYYLQAQFLYSSLILYINHLNSILIMKNNFFFVILPRTIIIGAPDRQGGL